MKIPKSIFSKLIQLKKNTIKPHSISQIQSGYSNFYAKESIQPWIPVAATGPWIFNLFQNYI